VLYMTAAVCQIFEGCRCVAFAAALLATQHSLPAAMRCCGVVVTPLCGVVSPCVLCAVDATTRLRAVVVLRRVVCSRRASTRQHMALDAAFVTLLCWLVRAGTPLRSALAPL
jgi:hypothetical protein